MTPTRKSSDLPPTVATGTESPVEVITKSGRRLDLHDPRAVDVGRPDVIAGLTGTCRFAAQTEVFYSVAQHAIMVADLVECWLDPWQLELPEEARSAVLLAALHHDSHEAFMSDLPAPVKRLLPGYEDIARKLDRAVHEAVGLALDLERTGAGTLIDRGDMAARCVEAEAIIPRASEFILEHAGRPDPEDLELARSLWSDPLLPPAARDRFIEREESFHQELLNASVQASETAVGEGVLEGLGVVAMPLPWFSQDPY